MEFQQTYHSLHWEVQTRVSPYLKPTDSGKNFCFDRKAIELLMENFPEDKILQAVYSIKRKKTAIQQYNKLLEYSDKDRFYPNYFMLSAASGRFTSEKPEFQNLLSKSVAYFKDENPLDYNVRTTLLGEENVFEIDFANQEARYMAWHAKEPSMIKAYLGGEDLADRISEDLKIERRQAKTVLYGLPYGRGAKNMKSELGVSYTKSEQIYHSFWDKYLKIKDCWDELKDKDSIQSPILGRTIRFSKFKEYTKFNWLVQGGCVDLLLVALDHILNSEIVELRVISMMD